VKARDVMTQPALSVAPDTPLRDVAALMLERRISGVPVIDGAGRVLGVVSEGDFLRRPEIESDGPGSGWLRLFVSPQDKARDYLKTHGRTAADVMSTPALTVVSDASLATVARLMSANGVKRLPVLEDGRLVGIVTRADLLRAVYEYPAEPHGATSDEEIRRAITEILEKIDWAAGAIVDVQVEQGIVQLRGSVDSDAQREALVLAARGVAGVRGVEAHLARLLPG
jgi:CBS domain-containing protein